MKSYAWIPRGLLAFLPDACAGSGAPDGTGSVVGSSGKNMPSGQQTGSGNGQTGSGSTGGGGDPNVTAGGSGSGTVSGSGTQSGGGSSSGAGTSGDGSVGSSASGGASGSSGGSGNQNGGTPGMCGETLPAITDYSKNGPFTATTINSTGPSGAYTTFQPMPLGQNGFKHPVATWGNGITTTPSYYTSFLSTLASHGFVVIASNSSSVTTQNMTDGLDWVLQQSDYQGKIDAHCLVAIGYSLGGGAAVGAGAHADMVTTVSFHGVTGNSAALKTPLLLFTSETDTFVTASGFVTPTFQASAVQTFYATLTSAGDPSNLGHLLPVSLLDPNDPEYAPAVAWLRLWVYGDQGGRDYFDGSDALLCKAPWTCQSKRAGGTAQMSGF
jgi:hypothetical protein